MAREACCETSSLLHQVTQSKVGQKKKVTQSKYGIQQKGGMWQQSMQLNFV